MRRRFPVLIVWLTLLAALSSAEATGSGWTARFRLFGSLYTGENAAFHAFRPHQAGGLGPSYADLALGGAWWLSPKVEAGLRTEARWYPNGISAGDGVPANASTYDVFAPRRTEFRLSEAWLRFAGVLGQGLDIKLGRQRIRWGASSGWGVLDDLNPIDFARLLTFDPASWNDRRPQWSAALEWKRDGSSVQLIWILERPEAPLPRGFVYLLQGSKQGPKIELQPASEREDWGGPSFGLRWRVEPGPVAFSLSYYRGSFALPVLDGWAFDFGPTSRFLYARQSVLGADGEMRLGPVRLWAEAGLVMPEARSGHLEYLGWNGTTVGPLRYHFPLFKKTAWKYAAGVDIRLPWLEASAGALRGLFDEFPFSTEAGDAFGTYGRQFSGPLSSYLTGRLTLGEASWPFRFRAEALWEIGGTPGAFVSLPRLEARLGKFLEIQAGARLVLAPVDAALKLGLFRDDDALFVAFVAGL
jgi:hypothetical protein